MIYFSLSKISWQEYDARKTSYYDSRKTEVHLKSLQRSALSPLVTSFCTLLRGLGSCDLFPLHSLVTVIFPLRCQVAGESDGVAWKYLMSPFTAFLFITQTAQVKTSYFPFDIHQLRMLQVSEPTNLLQRSLTCSHRQMLQLCCEHHTDIVMALWSVLTWFLPE